MTFVIDTLRVNRAENQLYFDNFATPAQATNFRRQFRKIICDDLVHITCGKSKVDKSKYPAPYNPATLEKGRIEVQATSELFDIIYLMLEMSLSLYIGKRKLFVYDVDTEEIYQPSPTISYSSVFPVGEQKRFGELHLEDANPYQIGNVNTGFAPPVCIIQVDTAHNVVFCKNLPHYTPVNLILEKLEQFTPDLNYQVAKQGTSVDLTLHLRKEDMFLLTVMLFFALDIALFGYRILISPDLFATPNRAFEIAQVV
ncbi:MAG: hypothetical protein ACRCXZ_10450 [Patescibacteria group bacterium]